MSTLYTFISGMIACGCTIAGFFFLRFWKRTHDRLFVMFASAFWLLAFERLAHAVLYQLRGESHVAIFTLRLVAFTVIAAAIIDKNRSERR